MSGFALRLGADPYPQRRNWQQTPLLDRLWARFGRRAQLAWALREGALDRFVHAVARHEAQYRQQSPAARQQALASVRLRLRQAGLSQTEPVAQAFALIRIATEQILGFAHHPCQIKGARVMLAGCIAEMNTGEGKTVTAVLTAATAALAGLRVHVVTVNDYLAERDLAELAPIYEALGLTTARVSEGMDNGLKQAAYQADIVYCTNKTIVFDYLRDRLELAGRTSVLSLALDVLRGRQANICMRGLQFAIVDEADSVFVDEARTPLIISRAQPNAAAELWYQQAMGLAGQLKQGTDYQLQGQGRRVKLSEVGEAALALSAQSLGGLWLGERRRREVIEQALVALHGFQRDVHYIVRDEKVQIVDEHTGRVMADRSWERGLQQLIEIKEGVPLSHEKTTLAKLSYQLFFRRYQYLAGMSGTCHEVTSELAEVYGVGVRKIAPHRASSRCHLPVQLFADSEARWAAVLANIEQYRARGQALLVGTASIAASEILAAKLQAAGIDYALLNAKQDAQEAAIVAQAGSAGRVTIATNMAGRGTDIKLAAAVREAGGLHVILTQLHDSSRIDRQLIGRGARQGDPGTVQMLLCLDDEIVLSSLPPVRALLKRALAYAPQSRLLARAGLVYYRFSQYRRERHHAALRQQLLQADFQSRNALSFTGQME